MGCDATWKPVVGYEGFYEVSRCGRVRSKDRITRGRNCLRKVKGREIKFSKGVKGYLRVNLWLEGRQKTIELHRILLEAFKPTRDPSLQVNHKDGNKINNNLDNLEWVTAKENVHHARNMGLYTKSVVDRGPLLKVVKELRESGLNNVEIGKILGLHRVTISRIYNGK